LSKLPSRQETFFVLRPKTDARGVNAFYFSLARLPTTNTMQQAKIHGKKRDLGDNLDLRELGFGLRRFCCNACTHALHCASLFFKIYKYYGVYKIVIKLNPKSVSITFLVLLSEI
jgi:hypothetical protein